MQSSNHQIIKSSKSSVKKFARLSSALVISTLLVGQAVFAAPFSFEYNDTVGASGSNPLPAGLTVGAAVEITVTLDNGGATNVSQTWTAAHLQSVKFNFGNCLITTFTTPFGGSLDGTTGSFVTDGSGNLTAVMSDWQDSSVGVNYTTGGTVPIMWFLNSSNGVYYTANSEEVNLTNVASMGTASNWSVASPMTGTCGGGGGGAVSAPIDLNMNKPAETFATEIELK